MCRSTNHKQGMQEISLQRSLNAGAVVPLQFGREVLAQVLEKPDLAHWKACVQETDKETELTAAFRESIAPYAPEDD